MRLSVLIMLFFIFSRPIIAPCQTSDSIDQREVYKTILLIGNAWSQNNLDTLEKYIDQDYKHTDTRGAMLNRASWLSYVKERKEKNVKNPNVEFEDTQIKIYNGFAFVTGINSFSGQAYTSNDSSNQKPRKLRYTQILRKEHNTWKRIIFQATYLEHQ